MIDALFQVIGEMTNAIQPLLYGQQYSLALFAIVMAAGLVAGVTPFGLTTMVVVGGRINATGATTKRQAFRTATLFSLGTAASLLAVGAIAVYAGQVLIADRFARYLPIVTLLLGLHLLGLWRWRLPFATPRTPSRSASNAFVLGLPFGIVTAPCTAPIILTVLSVVAANGGLVFGLLVLLAFTVGRSIPLVAACTYSGRVRDRLQQRTGWSRQAIRMVGVVIVVGSVYFLTAGSAYLGA
jgi:cytochrome c-type biogenesis protein